MWLVLLCFAFFDAVLAMANGQPGLGFYGPARPRLGEAWVQPNLNIIQPGHPFDNEIVRATGLEHDQSNQVHPQLGIQ